jgi:CRISPR system Cascade subunit CasE
MDPKNRQVQSETGNRYELHRTLTAQFPVEDRTDIGLLYRLEIPTTHDDRSILLLVQSFLEPHWEALVAAEMLTNDPEIKHFDPDFRKDANYFFRLLGNPTIRRTQHNGKSKRVGLYTSEEQIEWLNRKAAQSGFQILDLKLLDYGLLESLKRKNNKAYIIKHQAVQFDGLLRVTNTDKFLRALKNGIGSAKAFGFGLLSLAK